MIKKNLKVGGWLEITIAETDGYTQQQANLMFLYYFVTFSKFEITSK